MNSIEKQILENQRDIMIEMCGGERLKKAIKNTEDLLNPIKDKTHIAFQKRIKDAKSVDGEE